MSNFSSINSYCYLILSLILPLILFIILIFILKPIESYSIIKPLISNVTILLDSVPEKPFFTLFQFYNL